jgi:hypothetical protein
MTMTLVETVTVGSGGQAAIEFLSIPQTGTDLLIKISGRTTTSPESSNWTSYQILFNGSSSSFTMRSLFGPGSGSGLSTTSSSGVSNVAGWTNSSAPTANTFGSGDIYIPNYAGSANKSLSADNVTEHNGTDALAAITATLWANTAAITSVTLKPPSGNWAQYTTASLYTITKGSGGATVS